MSAFYRPVATYGITVVSMGFAGSLLAELVPHRIVIVSDDISVLHVDDEPAFSDLAEEYLKRVDDRITVESATHANEALERIATNEFDCVVSDYDMPDVNGIEFLKTVRKNHPNLPFIMFTGKGSETVASDAISAGVTDYLQKGGTEKYMILANRIRNAVDQQRARTNYREIFENVPDGVSIHDPADGAFLAANQEFCEMLGYTREELLALDFTAIHINEPPYTTERARQLVQKTATDGPQTFEWVDETKTGEPVPVEVHLRQTVIDGDERVLAVVRDISRRKEREQALERSKQRYHTLAENFPNGAVLVFDTDLRYRTVGGEGFEALGVAPEDYEGKRISEVFEGETLETVRELYEATLAGEPRSREMQYGDRVCQVYTIPIRDDCGTVFSGIVITQDITDRTRREDELKRERDRFITLFENLPNPVVEGEMIDGKPVIRQVNPAFETVFGYDADAVVGDNLDDLTVPEDRRSEARAINEQILEDHSVRTEVRRHTADGPRDFVLNLVLRDGDDDPGEGYAIYTDITERKRHQERFRSFIEHSTDVITVLAPDGTYKYQSPAGTRVTGYDDEELLGDTIFEYVHPDDRESVREAFDAGLTNPEHTPTVEYRFRHKDGTWRWLESIGNNQLDNPAIEGVVVNSRDITPRKEQERQLRERTAELERQNERLDEFASVVSHDLRNPLEVAIAGLELYAGDHNVDHLRTVEDAHDRMQRLIDDLLVLAQEGETVSDPGTVDLRTVAEDCWQTVSTADATLAVDTNRRIRADLVRIRQLLENVFRNAVEHGGPSVEIRVGDLDETGFYVADTGPGIPTEDQEDVFTSGYSTAAEGTGFGLSIVEEIADAHDWQVSVTESVDGGARFEFTGIDTVE